MKLWGGRFSKATDGLVDDFHSSISFDQRLAEQDITGSIAHATMLGEQGIIPQEDAEKIVEGLRGILADVKAGKVHWMVDAEDIHMNVEKLLTERIGPAGGEQDAVAQALEADDFGVAAQPRPVQAEHLLLGMDRELLGHEQQAFFAAAHLFHKRIEKRRAVFAAARAGIQRQHAISLLYSCCSTMKLPVRARTVTACTRPTDR